MVEWLLGALFIKYRCYIFSESGTEVFENTDEAMQNKENKTLLSSHVFKKTRHKIFTSEVRIKYRRA